MPTGRPNSRQLQARRDTAKTEATAAEKGWHRNYAEANNRCSDAPSFDERAIVLLPALFTRSCCLHQELSTTSSATRATKSLQSLLILAEKAGVGGSTPSLATIILKNLDE